jgi:hypothetical protein
VVDIPLPAEIAIFFTVVLRYTTAAAEIVIFFAVVLRYNTAAAAAAAAGKARWIDEAATKRVTKRY